MIARAAHEETLMEPISLERIYAILQTYARGDDVLRLHLENAERQATVEAQVVRIEELEAEIRRRLDEEAEADAVDPTLTEVLAAHDEEVLP